MTNPSPLTKKTKQQKFSEIYGALLLAQNYIQQTKEIVPHCHRDGLLRVIEEALSDD